MQGIEGRVAKGRECSSKDSCTLHYRERTLPFLHSPRNHMSRSTAHLQCGQSTNFTVSQLYNACSLNRICGIRRMCRLYALHRLQSPLKEIDSLYNLQCVWILRILCEECVECVDWVDCVERVKCRQCADCRHCIECIVRSGKQILQRAMREH